MDTKKLLLLTIVLGLIFTENSIAFDGSNLLHNFEEMNSFLNQNNDQVEQVEDEDVELVPEVDDVNIEITPEDRINELIIDIVSLPEVALDRVIQFENEALPLVISSAKAIALMGFIEREYNHENGHIYRFSEAHFRTIEQIKLLAEAHYERYFYASRPCFYDMRIWCESIILVAGILDLNYAISWMLKRNGLYFDDGYLFNFMAKLVSFRKFGCLISIIEYLIENRHKQGELVDFANGIDDDSAHFYRSVLRVFGLVD